MGAKIVLLSREPIRYHRSDKGYSLQYFLSDPKADEAFNVVLQSNEEEDKRRMPSHTKAREFAGKRVKVTIETLD